MARSVVELLVREYLVHALGKLCQGESPGLRGQGEQGLGHSTETGLLQIHPSETSLPALCGLDEVIEDAVGEGADVCGLHDIEKIDHHALETGQHGREFLDGFAAAQSLDVVRDGLDLQIRPIHHHNEKRVRAHLFLCMLAYYVKWHMSEAWRGLLFADED